jgi:AmmeMemoRadiSam system protein A
MSEEKPGTITDQDSDIPELNAQERRELLHLARAAITEAVNNNPAASGEKLEQLEQKRAAVFVTLWQPLPAKSGSGDGKQLRGCIGRLQPDLPLAHAVRSAAISAATHDPRFLPVQAKEIDNLIIEISILSPLKEVTALDEILIGQDGLVIEAMGRRGLLLPKVATRLGWSRKEFIQNLCQKAGLPEDIWPSNGRLYKFSTVEFHD